MTIFKHRLEATIASQTLQNITLNTINILNRRKEAMVLRANLSGLHPLDIRQVNE